MRGVILAGGLGTHLGLLTRITNKHLLPVYNKPMIYYPLQTLIDAKIKEILIVSGPEHAGHFLNLLGSGKEFGVKLSYTIQDEAGGIAQALSLAEDFVEDDNVVVILGDNIFEDKFDFSDFTEGAKVYLKAVSNPERFAVAEVKGDKIISIEERPQKPKSKYTITGLYLYENSVFDIIRTLEPSERNQLEITNVNNVCLKRGVLKYEILNGFWSNARTFESLHRASSWVKNKTGK